MAFMEAKSEGSTPIYPENLLNDIFFQLDQTGRSAMASTKKDNGGVAGGEDNP